MNTVSGIYMIACKITGKSYIGKTIGKIRQRVMYHLNGNTPGCVALHSAIKKYGKENFTWEVLHENVIPELLSAFEMEAIQIYNTLSPAGYNLTRGGETGFHSEETVRKRTKTLRANPPMKGKKHTPEACRKMSESRTGLKRTKEQRLNISKSLMGHEVPLETREKISEANQLSQKSGAHDLYLSLPSEMPRREKTRILSAKFQDVKRKTINYWMSEWEPHTSQNRIRTEAYNTFCSLPTSLTLQQKRNILKEKYSADVCIKTIKNWVLKWKSEVLHAMEPRDKGHIFFLTLPFDMSLKEKRQTLYSTFPTIKKPTIEAWVKKWQSELEKETSNVPVDKN